MTYNAEVQFRFDATYTHSYGGFGSNVGDDDFIPEEHYLITAPAGDLNAKQYFKLFEKFMLCVGMCPQSIRSGAMSLVFNDWTGEEEQRKVCKEYELTMDEDLEDKFKEWKERDAQWAKMNAHYEKNFGSEPKDLGRFQRFIQYTDEQLQVMADMYDRAKIKGDHYTDEELDAMCDKAASDEEKKKCQEYNLREAEYYNQRAKLDLQQQTDLIGLD